MGPFTSRIQVPKWQRRQVAYAVFEQEASGRLMAYHPKTGDLEVLLEGLYFANGVQLSPEGDHLLVAESTSARIIKYEYSHFVRKLQHFCYYCKP